MPVSEDTVTSVLVSYLREQGIRCDVQRTIKLADGTTVRPDIWIENHGIYLGEADWERKETEGWGQAYTYSQAPGASGAFLILYPESLKSESWQTTLTGESDPILSRVKYTVAFLRRGARPDMAKVTLSELGDWLQQNIHKKREPQIDIGRTIRTLRATVRELEKELGEVEGLPDLFRSVVGSTITETEVETATQNAAAYILLNQLVFYRILSKKRRDVPRIDPYLLRNPAELDDKYFAYIRDNIDYKPVFSARVASQFSSRSLEVLKNCIQVVYGLSPEFIDQDVLGKVFHSLIPFSTRKTLGAYYTLGDGADLLADIVIERAQDRVMDPACGSGTLLVSAFKRKNKLLGRAMTDTDFKQFLEEDITGIDVMPFAAHLSTIHLSLQGIGHVINRMRIAIEDSTVLEPGIDILPLSRITSGGPQKTIEDFQKPEIETGVVTPDGSPGQKISLDYVDVVIMNPPFTRQQRVTGFGVEYKDELLGRFENYTDYIGKRMKYAGYFLLLADKFLQPGGRIGAVLPVNMLRGLHTMGLRQWLLENYDLEFIITREDQSNFSEETDLRECLLIARKQRHPDNLTSFVSIKEMKRIDAYDIVRNRRSIPLGGIVETDTLKMRSVKQEDINFENVFREVSLLNYQLISLWDQISQSKSLVTFTNLSLKWSHRNAPTPKGSSFKLLCLNAPQITGLRGDKWKVFDTKKDKVVALHFSSGQKVEISKSALKPTLRRMTGRGRINLSSLKEYVIVKEFDGYDKFQMLAQCPDFDWDEWVKYNEARRSNLFFVTRCNISAPGTRLLGYFSKTRRSASRAGFSVIHGMSNDEAMVQALWLNSTYNILQMLIDRAETEGAWMELHKYTVDQMKILNPSDPRLSTLLATFKDVSKHTFPPIWQQMAMCSSAEDLSSQDMDLLEKAFPEIQEFIGVGFQPRVLIDNAIANLLDLSIDNRKATSEILYPGLLKEIAALKLMMIK